MRPLDSASGRGIREFYKFDETKQFMQFIRKLMSDHDFLAAFKM